ncbi:MAG: glycosyltransferase family 2 protein, partial [Anaerolineaceae bacterium]|nr:glycosyltransferase family 2 protein [Anaerolineaceae bacterium]
MSLPMVSIIIPVYNRPVEFERALQSALAQDYPNIEVIVVDDGSEDDIQTVVQRNLDNSTFSILYHRQENKGVGGARQKGVQLSNSVYIQHLDADDTISPNKISSQVKALEENPSAVACICGAQDNL